MTLPDWLIHRAATMPERTAVVAGARTWTFAELDAEAAKLAARLAGHGVRAGDRIAMLLTNSPGSVMMVHAMLRLHATLVPLNTRSSDAELAWQVGDATPRLLVVDERTESRADAVCAEAPDLPVLVLDSEAARGTQAAGTSHGTSEEPAATEAATDATAAGAVFEEHDPDAILALIYTSGTTGRPKGAMLTVGNFWWSAIGSALNLGTHGDDRWLACLPLFHVGGLSIVLRAAIGGFAIVIHETFDAGAVNRAIDEDRITTVSVVAVMLQRMLDARGPTPYPRSLRTVLVGGGPVPRALLDRCVTLGVPVVQTYGLTETASQVVTLSHSDTLHRLGAAGRALYPTRIRVALDGRDAAPGEAGRILVRGPTVMAGYWGRAEPGDAIVDGWLETGDVGYLDADGFLFVLDRRDDLIITGGENVYPAEVEAVLLAYPGVAEAGVIGLADPEWGHRVVAVVRLDAPPGTNIVDALLVHCRAQLAGYKVPREIRIVNAPLPRTASGKLQRAELRASAASQT